MKLQDRIKKETALIPQVRKGYSRNMASSWYGKTLEDHRKNDRVYASDVLSYWHERGYLSSSIKRYDLYNNPNSDRITDLEYLYLQPFNNSFSKWLEDILTVNRVFQRFDSHLRNVYFSIIQREGAQLILRVGQEDREYTVDDILDLIREKGAVELRPAFWSSSGTRHLLTVERTAIELEEPVEGAEEALAAEAFVEEPLAGEAVADAANEAAEKAAEEAAVDAVNAAAEEAAADAAGEAVEETFYSNGYKMSVSWLKNKIRKLKASYVIADPVNIKCSFGEGRELDHALKLWIANDAGRDHGHTQVLCAVNYIYWDDPKTGKRRTTAALVDLKDGSFEFQEERLSVPNWPQIRDEICTISATVPQLNFFTASIAVQPDGGFQFLRFSANPTLPGIDFPDVMNKYLKSLFARRFKKRDVVDRAKNLQEKVEYKSLMRTARPGIRPYMQRLWNDAKRDDLLHTKGVPLKTKLWAHKRGFLSFRTYQYGLTQYNYTQFLSDYDYYWLNRINNLYQKWVNDKTTYRYVMEPFKEFVPKYYFSCFKRGDNVVIKKMLDCPEDIPEGFEGLLEILKREGKLAFKASAGTHGDGFYCLEYKDGVITVNGEPYDVAKLHQLVLNNSSFYVATEYLEMHDELKKIYPKSVNTVRVMVINAHGYDPKIMQTYMRIGSEKTGFTDNVGYGGVCAMINTETGELYNPEQLVDHRYVPCPVHPDTRTPIAGVIPNWEFTKGKILEICRYFAELEYLGFDVAITNDGFQILEINIHQDLHKVASFSKEINEFFSRKISRKKKTYRIK